MAAENRNVDKILFDGNTYNLTDSGAARTNHTHTYNDVGAASANHTHTTQIELNNTQGNANIQLAYNTKYTLKTGGTTYTFKMPIASTGTVTSLTMNNVSKTPDSNGVIDLGTVITSLPTIPSITLNGSSTTSPSFYAPTGAGTSGQYLKSNGTSSPTWTNFPTIPSITLNGSNTTSPSFYAPTGAGSSGQYLKSNGTGAPTWANFPTIPSITLNGSSTTSPNFYAPTSAGTSGYYLKSNGTGAPTWTVFPTSLPASDVSSWAKQSTKPTYTASEVGAATSDHTHPITITSSSETGSQQLSLGQTYNLTAGGSNILFTMPLASQNYQTSFNITYDGDNVATDGAGKAVINFAAGDGLDYNVTNAMTSKISAARWGVGSTLSSRTLTVPANGIYLLLGGKYNNTGSKYAGAWILSMYNGNSAKTPILTPTSNPPSVQVSGLSVTLTPAETNYYFTLIGVHA